MSDRIVLTLRQPLREPVEADAIRPDALAGLTAREIAALPVWVGSRRAHVGDLFAVEGEVTDRLYVEGDLAMVHGLGTGMASGELTIVGNAGRRVAAGMTGGTATVRGDTTDDAGMGMCGGVLRIEGSTGDRLAAADAGASKGMTGGEVIVTGDAGAQVAARARRGLVVVGGNAGAHAAHRMIAGTLVVLGRTGTPAAWGNKRGSLIALGTIDVPETYAYACTFEPPHVRLLLQYLRHRRGLPIAERWLTARYRRFCGDAGDPGKGEILVPES
jgi:formylmethanofuran dehydrogenase subunit C